MHRLVIACAVLVTVLAGCSPGSGNGGSADCTDEVRFQQTTYLGYAFGERELMQGVAGEGSQVECIDDGSGDEPDLTPIDVYAVADYGTDDVIGLDLGENGVLLLFRDDLSERRMDRMIADLTGPRG